jgi:hypothetical protein
VFVTTSAACVDVESFRSTVQPSSVTSSAPLTSWTNDGAPWCPRGAAASRDCLTLTAFTLSVRELALYCAFDFSCAAIHWSSSTISFLCATMILLAMSRIWAFFPFLSWACAIVIAI